MTNAAAERIRQCYLVLVHTAPAQLLRLVQVLRAEGARFYIHVDRTTDDGPFRSLVQGPDVRFVEDRVQVHWAGFSMVEAELALLRSAYAELPGAERFTLLSGSCYPVASNAALLALADSPRNLISVKPVDPESKPYARIRRAYLPDHPVLNARGNKALHRQQAALRRYLFEFLDQLPDLAPPDFVYCKGMQWWSLRRDAVSLILDFCRDHPGFVNRFRYSWVPDEAFFHTILGNSALAPSCGKPSHYVAVKSVRFGASLDESDLQDILDSGRWFARKIDLEHSAALLDRLDTLRAAGYVPAARPEAAAARAALQPPPVSGAATVQIESSELLDGQAVIRGRTAMGPGTPARIHLLPAASERSFVAALDAAGGFEFSIPIAELPVLSGLRYSLHLGDLQARPLRQLRDAKDRIWALRLETREWFFHNVQNRATHVRDRVARLRLVDEARERFPDDAEVQVACFCIRCYDAIDHGTLQPAQAAEALAQRSWLDQQLAGIQGAKHVRWTGSSHTVLGYIALTQQRWEEARECFERVAGLMPRASEWPSIEVNVMRASFSLGYLAAVRGELEAAEHWWSQAITFCQGNVALKDFSNYYKIEETYAALGVAASCSIGLAKLRRRRHPSDPGPVDVAGLPLRPSSVHGRYLAPLEALAANANF